MHARAPADAFLRLDRERDLPDGAIGGKDSRSFDV